MRKSGKIISVPGKMRDNSVIPLGEHPTGDEYDIIITFIKKNVPPKPAGFMRYAGAITDAQAKKIESRVNECREIDIDSW